MSKTLCDWSKHDIKHHLDQLAALLRHPTFFCRKCARAANDPSCLCKPQPLPFSVDAESPLPYPPPRPAPPADTHNPTPQPQESS